MTAPDKVIVGPSPLKLLGTMGLGGLGMIAGAAMVLAALFGLPRVISSAWIVASIVGVLATASYLAHLLRGRPCLEIGPHDFVMRTLLGSRTRRWSEIDGDFVAIKVGFAKGAGYCLLPEFKKSPGKRPAAFAGNDEAISGAFELPMDQLVQLLNDYKRRATTAAAPPS